MELTLMSHHLKNLNKKSGVDSTKTNDCCKYKCSVATKLAKIKKKSNNDIDAEDISIEQKLKQ